MSAAKHRSKNNRLAGKGVKVAILDLNAEAGEKLAKELSGTFAKCDVTSEPSVDAADPEIHRARPGLSARAGSWAESSEMRSVQTPRGSSP